VKEPIVALYEYGEWANARLLDKAEALTPGQLAQTFSKGTLAILPTFGHLIGADIRWLARFQNQTPPTLSVADFPSLDVVRRRFEEVRAARRSYLASLDNSALRATIRWVRDDGAVEFPRWQALLQCANHGTQHRAEIAAMLTDLGRSPKDLDFSVFCLERMRK
jgi:uncharacterized damage-inducible protein DinB